MKTYQVRLTVPTAMWAIVEVEATCEEDAVKQAFEANKAGTVSYEFSGCDTSDAELSDVEEVLYHGDLRDGLDEVRS